MIEKTEVQEGFAFNDSSAETFFGRLEQSVEIDKPDLIANTEKISSFWNNLELEVFSTYEERLCQTPRDGERGFWDGIRGEANYIPYESKMRELLAEYGTDRVSYQDAVPDFSKFSEATVKIDHMSPMRQGRGGNFEQADQKCAVLWNQMGRDGRTDWAARDVADFRRNNGLSWHECNDRKTCQMIPTEINDYFGHLGGVAECKKADRQEDLFDE